MPHDPGLPAIGTRHHAPDGTVREVVAVDPAGQWIAVSYRWPDGTTSRGRLGYWPGGGWSVTPPAQSPAR